VAKSQGTDCYPRTEIDTWVDINDLNEAYLYNPRNVYQNYNAAINTSAKRIFTYMGILKPNMGNVTYSTSGQLSPLLNDPLLRTIGMGTRIFFGGAQGYVSWMGTQFNTACSRDENGFPLTPGATLALIGNMKEMDSRYIRGAAYEKYGTSMFVGVGIPIPILDEEMMKFVSVTNKDLTTNIIDYSVQGKSRPTIKNVSYEELRSGSVDISGKKIKTSPMSSLKMAREIAGELKNWIQKQQFYLQEPVTQFPMANTVNGLEIRKAEK
jgi:uncharacterized protein (DUF39 family)